MPDIVANIETSRYFYIMKIFLSRVNLRILSNKRMIECEKFFYSNVSLKLAY